ncbi:glycosyltransferase family 2 protein [Hassallia byssoidea VB512170]|uniref:Glycosyltransferase family 2 protein n=1 Tax=Hassallia byssoidea VB512170 TaxID=1304833 RepID=A0A846H4Q2_9CYAN|nr:glycosyltransferase [Hassalia byssoidea]NEU71614.1 glycosyltransferase family 2 protein [Hassalia byssoidea VB512170]
MKAPISVITCTHNPRRDYFEKVLSALKSQTLPLEQWEFLLIDNASQQLLSSEIDLSWHLNARHIREEQLGLTPARLRGVKEAAGEILVFVDDDNVLDSDYLEAAFKISKDCSMIGAWGGKIIPEFEIPPPEWTKPHLTALAITKFEQDIWSNLIHHRETTPCGAGLCVRKIVAEKYAELIHTDPRRADMDRKGKLLTSDGDTDLALTACDIGLGTGLFTSLKLTHLIRASRLEEDYFLRLAEGFSYSGTILDYLRGKRRFQPAWRASKTYLLYLRLRYGSRRCRFYEASQKGFRLAQEKIADWENCSKS